MARSRSNSSAPAAARPIWLRWPGMVVVFVAALVLLLMFQPWDNNAESAADRSTRDAFASDRPGADEKIITIDGKRTMGYLEAICKIGPRISGSEGMKKQQELIEKHFTDLGAKVTYQKFTAKQKSVRKPVDMANMIVSYHPERARRVILCSHYDTRPIADQEPNPRRWTDPFISANDGGSGVALLMELGHHMKDLKTSVGVDFVFFDGEEFIYNPKREVDEYFFGSKHFAKEWVKVKKKVTYTGAILFDMIAGKGAEFPIEKNSKFLANKLVKEVWDIAREQKCAAFKDRDGRFEVEDDHIPLNRVGIPAIDIIDFEYPHWHLLSDLPKNCSSAPMEQVAKVVMLWVQRTK